MALDPLQRHGRSRAALKLINQRPVTRLLDWGCGEGEFAEVVARTADFEVLACDVDEHYVAAVRSRPSSRVTAVQVDDLRPSVDLGDNTVDLVTCLDVLEHMGEESRIAALSEIHRLLRSDGRLIITVPHHGLLHWADPENVKFRVPRLHRAVYRFARGAAAYEATYGSASRFGNYSLDGRWHNHFTRPELIVMLKPWFREDETIYFGLIHPIVRYLMYVHQMTARRLGRTGGGLFNRALWSAYIWDADHVGGALSYNLGMSFTPRTDITTSDVDGR
jgi:SAM-dependent methyltransferase